MTLLVSLWILPGLITTVTPLRYGEVIGAMRDVLLTAFMTANLFIVLPMLVEKSQALMRAHGLGGERDAALPEVIVPASFNFPHVGKLLTLSFILFAGWFADAAVAASDYPRLATTGLVVLFGNINAAVPFLLDLFRIPADTFQLFLATSVVNARFGTLVAAAHTIVMALVGSWAIVGRLQLQRRSIARYRRGDRRADDPDRRRRACDLFDSGVSEVRPRPDVDGNGPLARTRSRQGGRVFHALF